jgi:hypothetical protein
MQTLALKGQIAHYMGHYGNAEAALLEAEQLRMAHCADRRPVRSLYLLDLLSDLGRYDEMLEVAEHFRPLLDARTSKPFTGAFYLFVGQGLALRAMQRGSQEDADRALDGCEHGATLDQVEPATASLSFPRCVGGRNLSLRKSPQLPAKDLTAGRKSNA